MVKAVVIGAGMIGRNHTRVYKEIADCELVGVSDVTESVAHDIGSRFGVAHHTDFRALLDTVKPDLASVSVPTVHHFEVVKELIARGIHVLVEKPITATIEQGQEIIALAKEANVWLAVGHIERFNPAVMELKKRLNDGQLGKPFRIHSKRMGPFPARIRDVGVVVDLATHDVDIVRYTLGTDITRVSAETAQGISTDREDIMDCVLRCENGVIGTLNINWMTPTKTRELTVTGSQGMFHVNYLTQDLYFYENDVAPLKWDALSTLTGVDEGNMTRLKLSRNEPLKAELTDFVHAVRDNRPPLVSGEDGLKALAGSLALVQSGQEGRTVQMSEWL
jgi:predicted dehydrogenase